MKKRKLTVLRFPLIAYNWFKMFVYWSISRLDIQLSTTTIPKDTPYCYSSKVDKDTGEFSTTPCPYYHNLGGDSNGCAYLGTITDDIIFADDVKICGIKEGSNNYVSDEYVKYQN